MGRNYLLHDGTLLDCRSGRPQHHRSVLVAGDRIAAVGAAGSVRVPDNTRYVDARGRTILPGLIDTHVHITGSGDPDPPCRLPKTVPYRAIEATINARELLLAGVTSARDAGAGFLLAVGVRDAISAGLVPGPRLHACGQGITGGHGDHLCPGELPCAGRYVVDSPDGARKAVREQLRSGADCIKVFATGGMLSGEDEPTFRSLTVDEMRAAVEAAHNAGARVLAHAVGAQGIKNALIAGTDSIEHGFCLDQEAIEMMLQRDVFLVPTLAAVHDLVTSGERRGVPAFGAQKAGAARECHLSSFRHAVEAGVKVAMGTDAGTPFNYHGKNALELQLMCEAGMTPAQALVSATRLAAELLGTAGRLGTIEAGKLADLILVGADPLEDISLLQDPRNIHLVMKSGEVVLNRGVRIGCLEPESDGDQVLPA